MLISTVSLCFTSMCSLKYMGLSFDKQVYLLDFGLNQHSRKGKGSKNVLCYGRAAGRCDP